MTPAMNYLMQALFLAAITCCKATGKTPDTQVIPDKENKATQIYISTENADVSRLVNAGLCDFLMGYQESAREYFLTAVQQDSECIMARLGTLMVSKPRSEEYREHLKAVNELLDNAVLTPVEEWYVSTFLQYLNGDFAGAATAFKERAELYRRDVLAACFDIVLNHYSVGKGGELTQRADALVERFPHNRIVHYCRALLEEHSQTPSEKALTCAKKAFSLSDGHPSAALLTGHLLCHSCKVQEAREYFTSAIKNSFPNSEINVAARLYGPSALIQTGDKKQWVEALKQARALSQSAADTPPTDAADMLLYWEGKSYLLRMLVLQSAPPAGPAINMAASSCNAPADHPLKAVQDCLVAAIRTRSLAETGRAGIAATTLLQAEQHLQRFQREGETMLQQGGIYRTCYRRAERACMGALYRAKMAIYKDSESIWKPHLDELLSLPDERQLPPVLPHSRLK